MCEIIGRKKEIAELKRYYESGRAEFVAVYGRRRVGKTFLIDEVFHDDMVFHHTGLSPYDRRRKVTLKDQLQNFYFSLLRHGMEDIAQPKSWMEAFFLLERFLETCDNGSRQVVLIMKYWYATCFGRKEPCQDIPPYVCGKFRAGE